MQLRWIISCALLSALLAPASALAQQYDEEPEPSLMTYGFRGLFSGAGVGLAAGYLATGSNYESDEWETLVLGAGIGALSGVGLGLLLGAADVGAGDPPGMGYYVIRDIGYGATLGALSGALVGGLFALDSDNSKDILTGAAWGTLTGAGVGVIFGIIEGAGDLEDRRTADNRAGVRFSLSMTGIAEGRPMPIPVAIGRF